MVRIIRYNFTGGGKKGDNNKQCTGSQYPAKLQTTPTHNLKLVKVSLVVMQYVFFIVIGTCIPYEGHLKSPCTCPITLQRMNKTIKKYIFSESKDLCRHFGILFNLFYNISTVI